MSDCKITSSKALSLAHKSLEYIGLSEGSDFVASFDARECTINISEAKNGEIFGRIVFQNERWVAQSMVITSGCGGGGGWSDRAELLECYPLEHPFQPNYNSPDKYKGPGPQTEAGPKVLESAEEALEYAAQKGGGGKRFFDAVNFVLHSKLKFRDGRDYEINTRSAEEVLASGYATGCHDYTIVASAILLAMQPNDSILTRSNIQQFLSTPFTQIF